MKEHIDVKLAHDEKNIYCTLQGEIDHHSVEKIRGEIDRELYRYQPPVLVMNMGEVGFMDSSGIGFVVGRVKLTERWHGIVRITNVPPHLMKLFSLAGLQRLSGLKIEGIT